MSFFSWFFLLPLSDFLSGTSSFTSSSFHQNTKSIPSFHLRGIPVHTRFRHNKFNVIPQATYNITNFYTATDLSVQGRR